MCVCLCTGPCLCARMCLCVSAVTLLCLSPVIWIQNPIPHKNFVERLHWKISSSLPQNTHCPVYGLQTSFWQNQDIPYFSTTLCCETSRKLAIFGIKCKKPRLKLLWCQWKLILSVWDVKVWICAVHFPPCCTWRLRWFAEARIQTRHARNH